MNKKYLPFIFILFVFSFFFIKNIEASSPVISTEKVTPNSVQIKVTGLTSGASYKTYISNKDHNTPMYNNMKEVVASSSGLILNSFVDLSPGGSYSVDLAGKFNGNENIISSLYFDTPKDSGQTNNPVIKSFSPNSGEVGTMVTLNGENFINLEGVYFNKVKAPTNTNTLQKITVKVPQNSTSGRITLKTSNGVIIGSNSDFVVMKNGNPVSANLTNPIINPSNPSATTPTTPTTTTNTEVKFKGLVPICNTTLDKDGNYSDPCNFNIVMALINKLINFVLITLATPLFALIIMYVGWLYLSAGGSSENITKAKTIMKNALFGYVIALIAWLIVKTILLSLGFNGFMYLV